MKIRKAHINDVESIHSLINFYAETDRMLFRSKADIYENLQSFLIAESDANIIGCCALQIIWSDLAEIKSLAVKQENLGSGAGKNLVKAAVDYAFDLGIQRIFALTLEPNFFTRLDFQIIEKTKLPMKVWSDCARCTKQDNCDETAVIYIKK